MSDIGEPSNVNIPTTKDIVPPKKGFNLIAILGICFLALLIIILIVLIFLYRTKLQRLENNQSTFCFQILCEANNTEAPCFGFAQREDDAGNTYCSNAPISPVTT